MNSDMLIPSLIFVTLAIVLVIGVIQYVSIMKRKKMRENTPLASKSEDHRASGEGTTVSR